MTKPRPVTLSSAKRYRNIKFRIHQKDGRVVFNIAGNKYRIVVWINYPYRVVYVRFIGSHRMYDVIDARTI